MTEEIKEILEYPTIYNFDDEPYLHGTDYVKLRDYITNLQQDLDKANDIIKKDRQFYKCRMDEYVDYKSRCKKAIEELTYMSTDAYIDNYDIRDKHYNLLMNILNGSEGNETK